MVTISIQGEAEEMARFLKGIGYSDVFVNGKRIEDKEVEKAEDENDLSEWRRPISSERPDFNPLKGYCYK